MSPITDSLETLASEPMQVSVTRGCWFNTMCMRMSQSASALPRLDMACRLLVVNALITFCPVGFLGVRLVRRVTYVGVC
jgi:hypothetical protein